MRTTYDGPLQQTPAYAFLMSGKPSAAFFLFYYYYFFWKHSAVYVQMLSFHPTSARVVEEGGWGLRSRVRLEGWLREAGGTIFRGTFADSLTRVGDSFFFFLVLFFWLLTLARSWGCSVRRGVADVRSFTVTAGGYALKNALHFNPRIKFSVQDLRARLGGVIKADDEKQ